MQPRFEQTPQRFFTDKKIITRLSNNDTKDLWKSFMPLRNSIPNKISQVLFAIEIYDRELDFYLFNSQTTFEKWAAVEVESLSDIPTELFALSVPTGLYAVFTHVGSHPEALRAIQHIFNAWLPGSEHLLDTRPHLEVMGAEYKNDSADSEEELWIPLMLK